MVWVKSRCSQSTDWSLLTSGVDILGLLFALNIYSGPALTTRRRRCDGASLTGGVKHTTERTATAATNLYFETRGRHTQKMLTLQIEATRVAPQVPTCRLQAACCTIER